MTDCRSKRDLLSLIVTFRPDSTFSKTIEKNLTKILRCEICARDCVLRKPLNGKVAKYLPQHGKSAASSWRGGEGWLKSPEDGSIHDNQYLFVWMVMMRRAAICV